jgi:hypothetical protein
VVIFNENLCRIADQNDFVDASRHDTLRWLRLPHLAGLAAADASAIRFIHIGWSLWQTPCRPTAFMFLLCSHQGRKAVVNRVLTIAGIMRHGRPGRPTLAAYAINQNSPEFRARNGGIGVHRG